MERKTIWDDLAVIMPGKTLVLEIDETEIFHQQEIFTTIKSVNKMLRFNSLGEDKSHVFVSVEPCSIYVKFKENDVFCVLHFDCSVRKVKFGSFEFDNIIVF